VGRFLPYFGFILALFWLHFGHFSPKQKHKQLTNFSSNSQPFEWSWKIAEENSPFSSIQMDSPEDSHELVEMGANLENFSTFSLRIFSPSCSFGALAVSANCARDADQSRRMHTIGCFLSAEEATFLFCFPLRKTKDCISQRSQTVSPAYCCNLHWRLVSSKDSPHVLLSPTVFFPLFPPLFLPPKR